ncbi:hypothetical protein QCA50_005945 [Cerrena zonata]|uniref:Uncharacterized protein n=1 Tax=Cerrena zonata TaxID=2478898 RepID=A0AAW0GKT2_9APHY
MFKSWSTLFLLGLSAGSTVKAAIADWPAAIIGTYNVTFALVAVPESVAYSLLPASYAGKIIPPGQDKFPGLEDGQLPIFLELGREKNAGPPGLNIENFQEAKIEVPFVKRLDKSEDPFLYKRLIAVDSLIDVIGGAVQFGLNSTLQTFAPSNSSNSSTFDYSIVNVVDAALKPTVGAPKWPLETFQEVGGLPWFAEYLLCAQHFYNWTSSPEVTHLEGSVTLHPPYVPETTTFPAQAVHGVFDFQIKGALLCDLFV